MAEERNREDDFVLCGADTANMEQIATPPSSYWKVTLKRFSSNKVALVAAAVMLIIILLCIFGPILSGYEFECKLSDYEWRGARSAGCKLSSGSGRNPGSGRRKRLWQDSYDQVLASPA